MSKNLVITLTLGDAHVQIVVEADGYSPDVLDDMTMRAQRSMATLVRLSRSYGVPGAPDDVLDDVMRGT